MRAPEPSNSGNHPVRRLRAMATAALVIALSACATHTDVRTSSPAPAAIPEAGPATNPATGSAPTVKACPAGDGVVVRVVPINAAGRNANADLMGGGVVGGVLGNQGAAGDAHGGASGGGTNGDIVRYDLYVRLDRGDRIIVNQREAGGIVTGSRVTVESCRARLIR